MTAVKNGIKTTLRTPGKTLLFSLILTALAVLISIAFCVFASVRNYIDDCNDYYHTIVDLEFTGKNYPDIYAYDSAMVSALSEHAEELAALRADSRVIRFDPVTHALANVEGLTRHDRFVYDPDAGVFYVSVTAFDCNSGAFFVTVGDVIYSRESLTGKMIMMRTATTTEDGLPDLTVGENYLVCGHFFLNKSRYPGFNAEPMTFLNGDVETTLPEKTPIGELTPELKARYEALGDDVRLRNNSCAVRATANIEDLYPFHQQELTLSSGRFFEQKEYEDAAKVCIISPFMASELGIEEGAVISVSLMTCEGDLYTGALTETQAEQYTVIGIYNRNDDYPAVIFIPDASSADAELTASNGYWLGDFRIKNSGLLEFLEKAKKLEQYDFRVTAYDQGYSSVVGPMSELLLISVVFLAVCMALTVGVLTLQCHLFITRQRGAAQIMKAIGSGKRHITLYFLSSAALLSVPAAAVGCLIGKLTQSAVFRALERFAEQFTEQDLRFSSSRLTLTRALEFKPHVSPVVYLAAGLALLAGVCVFTLLFSRNAMKDRAVRKKRARAPRRVRRVRRSTRLSGTMKYSLLSIRRNPGRTAAVLLLCVIAALFFGRLTSTLDGYREQLASLKENTSLKGHATDIHGKKIDGLVLNWSTYDSLARSGLLSGLDTTRIMGHLRFSGVSVNAAGEDQHLPAPYIPTSPPMIENMIGQMYYEPKYMYTTSVRSNAIFYYADPVSVDWLEGFDEDRFRTSSRVCVMPLQLMSEYGVSLGDTALFVRAYQDALSTIEIKVVGSYLSITGDDTVFAPLDMEGLSPYLRNNSFESLVFSISSAAKLDELRDALEAADLSVVKTKSISRCYAVIDDEIYLETAQSMERQIKYVSALYLSLYILAVLIGFVLAWLVVSSRRKEIAVMRTLGTKACLTVAVFVLEQFIICGAGLAIGLLLRKLTGGTVGPQLWLLILLFFAVWLVSTLICLIVSVTKQAYAALSEPE